MEFPDFAWASGEECSIPVVPFEGQVVRVDELETTGHLARMEADVADAASLGISVWRYGMPWHRTETAPGEYDWSLWDRALAACDAAGLTPVIDLCHFGLPDHYEGFCEPTWVEGFIRYVEAFLARYPEPRFFTPVNEPVVTAFWSGYMGGWNDAKRSPEDFAMALAHCALADLEGSLRIRQDRDGWNVGAEGFSVWVAVEPAQREFAEWIAAHWDATWDLRYGKPLQAPADKTFGSVNDSVMARIAELATTENTIAGHDFYPVSVTFLGHDPEEVSIYDRLDVYEDAARRWHARYGLDFWISETSNLGLPVDQGSDWLLGLAGRAGRLRSSGVPVRGLCWYSRGDQHDWETALTTPKQVVTEVGLYDIERQPRPVAETFKQLAAAGPPTASV